MKLEYVQGDLIALALRGEFDAIAHGCNCFCRMNRGIAPQMQDAFGCNDRNFFSLEGYLYEGDINKLGQIQGTLNPKALNENDSTVDVWVYNMYTQYHWQDKSPHGIPLDYDALTLCLRKLNRRCRGLHVGLPKIGCGLAGGDWTLVSRLIEFELRDTKGVTVVEYKP